MPGITETAAAAARTTCAHATLIPTHSMVIQRRQLEKEGYRTEEENRGSGADPWPS